MERIRDVIRKMKMWDRVSTERELLREESKARAAEDLQFGLEPGLVSYIRELKERELASEAAYDITSILWQLAGIEANSRQTFETWVTDHRFPVLKIAATAVRDWAEFKGSRFLTLAGPPGAGKTHLAIAACQLIVSQGNTVMYRRVDGLLDQLRQATLRDRKEEVLTDIRLASFVILDDLGVEKVSEWSLATLDEIVDFRYSLRRNLLVCTNAKSEDLPPRVADRLADKSIGEVIQIAVPSFRRGR